MLKLLTSITFSKLTLLLLFATPAFAAPKALKILAYGDSLTAGYQLPPQDAYPAQLQNRLEKDGLKVTVVNGGVSGDTSAQGLRRVGWSLKQGPFDFVLLCMGANDGLRQLPLKQTRQNIRQMIRQFKQSKAQVVLLGISLPTNFDAQYRQEFEAIFRDLAREEKLPLVPFLLAGVATQQKLNLEDQIHPNREGYAQVVQNIYKVLRPLIL